MKTDYRRRAVLARIHTTLDAFSMRQVIDWDYDVRSLLDHIIELALTELEFGERAVDRGLIIVKPRSGGELEVGGGARFGEEELRFSRTIVREALATEAPVLYENASEDHRFQNAESLKSLDFVSLMTVPIRAENELLGAIYVERSATGVVFTENDVRFLEQFAETIAPYVRTALIHQDHVAEIRKLRTRGESSAGLPNLLGRSKSMERVIELARIAASVEKTVLITGESGCGKELFARAIHARSRRAQSSFVVVDCSSLSGSLLESELFGHLKGAFTGATSDRAGAFENADGGTLFLDEVSDAPKAMQQTLRRVLQEGEIRRVGDSAYRKVDVRVVCATNQNLQQRVDDGEFIHDLYHRIHQFPVRIPPLRERLEDVPLLARHFVGRAGEKKNPPVHGIEGDALAILMNRDYRANNVRELRNIVELAVDLTEGDQITVEVLRRTLEIREEPLESDGRTVTNDSRSGEAVSVDPGDPATHSALNRTSLVQFMTDEVRHLFEQTPEDAEKTDKPYYRLQREFSGKLIVEALRFSNWKLRPAAKLLGISPVKLRQDFKSHLEVLGRSAGGQPDRIARALGMPPEKLERKLEDLGVDI